jgi:hypothetical protein
MRGLKSWQSIRQLEFPRLGGLVGVALGSSDCYMYRSNARSLCRRQENAPDLLTDFFG